MKGSLFTSSVTDPETEGDDSVLHTYQAVPLSQKCPVLDEETLPFVLVAIFLEEERVLVVLGLRNFFDHLSLYRHGSGLRTPSPVVSPVVTRGVPVRTVLKRLSKKGSGG